MSAITDQVIVGKSSTLTTSATTITLTSNVYENVVFTGESAATLTLPALSGVVLGSVLTVRNLGTALLTVNRNAVPDVLAINSPSVTVTTTTVAVNNSLTLVAGSGNVWYTLSSSRLTQSVRSTSTAVAVAVTNADQVVLVDNTSGGALVVNLPATATISSGFMVTIKNNSAAAQALTVTPASGTINTGAANGAATLSLAQFKGAQLVFDGTNWNVTAIVGTIA